MDELRNHDLANQLQGLRGKGLLGIRDPERHVFEQLYQPTDDTSGAHRMEHLVGLVRCGWQFTASFSEQRPEDLGNA